MAMTLPNRKADDVLNAVMTEGMKVMAEAVAEEVTSDVPSMPVKEAKQSLLKDLLELLEDEPEDAADLYKSLAHARNQLRQELRTAIKNYFGGEE